MGKQEKNCRPDVSWKFLSRQASCCSKLQTRSPLTKLCKQMANGKRTQSQKLVSEFQLVLDFLPTVIKGRSQNSNCALQNRDQRGSCSNPSAA